MGKALQIRVIATTWNTDLLEELWPRLTELAQTIPVKHECSGVLEMVRSLSDGLQFLPWSEARRSALGPGIREAMRLKAALEAALADWKPGEANRYSDALEATLDALEEAYVD